MLVGDTRYAEINHCFMHRITKRRSRDILLNSLENYAKEHRILDVGIASDIEES